MSDISVAHLKVTLEDVEPAVMRRLIVPLKLRMDRLHLTLQGALGWTNSHLYEFRAGDIGWGIPDPDFGDGPFDARKAKLFDVVEDTGVRSFDYLYDFGDGWEHTIRIERIDDADPDVIYPLLVEATGRCPPEDIGGPPGYEAFLDAINDPDHEQHDELREWFGGAFDPHAIDVEDIRAELTKLGKSWTRKPRTKSSRASK